MLRCERNDELNIKHSEVVPMKGLNRWVVTGFAFLFLTGATLGTAHASTKKKKKKTEAKKVEHYHKTEAKTSSVIGVNTNGRPGLFFSDTAETPNKGQVMGAAGLQFNTAGSVLLIPVGGAYGLTPDLQLSANTGFYTGSGISGLNTLTVGGKYHITSKIEHLNFAGGLDLSIAPLYNTSYNTSTFNMDPYGVVTYSFVDGLRLNGQLGVFIPVTGYKATVYGTSVTVTPSAVVQCNLGVSYPFPDNLTGIAELGINGGGSGVTPLVVGMRKTLDKVQLQAFAGPDFGGTVGFLFGGSAALLSE